MQRTLSLAALSLAAALTLSACVDDAGTEPGADTGTTTSPSAQAPTGAGTVSEEHNQADVMFARMMIPHHEQAVQMSELMIAKDGISPGITDLATRIRDAQGPEIETMQGWLETWDDAMGPDSMESHAMGDMDDDAGADDGGKGSGSGPMEGMEGMLSEAEMSELDRAEGAEASRLFLESMTVHHEGAIDMAQDEMERGENPEAIELAGIMVTTQQAEINEMRRLLAFL